MLPFFSVFWGEDCWLKGVEEFWTIDDKKGKETEKSGERKF